MTTAQLIRLIMLAHITPFWMMLRFFSKHCHLGHKKNQTWTKLLNFSSPAIFISYHNFVQKVQVSNQLVQNQAVSNRQNSTFPNKYANLWHFHGYLAIQPVGVFHPQKSVFRGCWAVCWRCASVRKGGNGRPTKRNGGNQPAGCEPSRSAKSNLVEPKNHLFVGLPNVNHFDPSWI